MDTILGYDLFFWIKIFSTAFTAILFLQSSLDKIFNYADNLSFLKSHFSNSPLAALTPVLLPVITLLESLAGWLCGIGLFFLIFKAEESLAVWGHIIAMKAIVALFFGQRLAKDYAGAAALTPYFLYLLFVLYIFS